jgi:hypothetical protein
MRSRASSACSKLALRIVDCTALSSVCGLVLQETQISAPGLWHICNRVEPVFILRTFMIGLEDEGAAALSWCSFGDLAHAFGDLVHAICRGSASEPCERSCGL